MSKRDELAAVLGEHVSCGERYCETLSGYETCEDCRDTVYRTADAVLAWLGEQFDEGLREAVADAFGETLFRWHGTASSCDHKEEAMDVLAAVRERLGFSDAAQDAQDGTVGPGSVRMGTGEGAGELGRNGSIQEGDA